MAAKRSSREKVSLEKQVYDLKQLLEISKSLSSTLDMPVLIEAFLYICMGQFQTIGAALFTKRNFDSSVFQLGQNYYGLDVKEGADYSIPEEHPLILALSRCPACTTTGKLLEDGLVADEAVKALISLNPSLVVPLKMRGVVNGILVLGEQIEMAEYSNYEKEQAVTMASIAAVAINNALLFDMSTTDMMTRLRLKHFFFAALAEKIEAARNNATMLSVIMFDIDFFKRFNDTYGHECGDFVLKKTAEVIQNNTRADDLAARYGGEEFVVMLCDTDINEAEKIAERIRRSIEKMEIEYDGQHLAITISAGAAQYNPFIDCLPRDLVERADVALYVSKNNGRNRVTVMPVPQQSMGLGLPQPQTP